MCVDVLGELTKNTVDFFSNTRLATLSSLMR
jgi:hypothetical protein